MKVLSTEVESIGANKVQVTTILEITPTTGADEHVLGEGPTGNAVPDRIVRALIEADPDEMSPTDLHERVGGNQATVYRQAWTLASNAPDLQKRLRGWVVSTGRGRYALSTAARNRLRPDS